jgi:hypothetical protein
MKENHVVVIQGHALVVKCLPLPENILELIHRFHVGDHAWPLFVK